MARIRSVHPGQWRDQDFVECGFIGRLLAIALRNEADDQGIFEWKPKQIKMNCFPGDNVDIETALAELVANKIIAKFEIEGRHYGAIRNFRLYQRPKKPNAIYPMTDEIREYVGLNGRKGGTEDVSSEDNSEIEEAEDTSNSPPVGKSDQQMEDGGDKMEDGGGDKKASGVAPQLPSALPPPIICLPTNRFERTGEEVEIYEAFFVEMQGLYPKVDVHSELRKMRGWLITKPAERKTKKGMKSFVNRWLSKEQDRPAPRETIFGGRNDRQSSNGSFGSTVERVVDARNPGGGLFDSRSAEIVVVARGGDPERDSGEILRLGRQPDAA